MELGVGLALRRWVSWSNQPASLLVRATVSHRNRGRALLKMIWFPRGLLEKSDETAADGRIAQLARVLP